MAIVLVAAACGGVDTATPADGDAADGSGVASSAPSGADAGGDDGGGGNDDGAGGTRDPVNTQEVAAAIACAPPWTAEASGDVDAQRWVDIVHMTSQGQAGGDASGTTSRGFAGATRREFQQQDGDWLNYCDVYVAEFASEQDARAEIEAAVALNLGLEWVSEYAPDVEGAIGFLGGFGVAQVDPTTGESSNPQSWETWAILYTIDEYAVYVGVSYQVENDTLVRELPGPQEAEAVAAEGVRAYG